MKALFIAATCYLIFSCLGNSQTVIEVPKDYPTIQAGIDAASKGDTVLVAPGTYVENINFNGKAITVESEKGVSVTTIDGNQNGSVVTFANGESSSTILRGFTISKGTGTYNCSSNSFSGGGIYCFLSSPYITDNTICRNYATYGGGIAIDGTIHGDCSPQIINNSIVNNSASWAGGISASFSANISNNIISHNIAKERGGGLRYSNWMDLYSPNISNNIISNNTAELGGGIYIITGLGLSLHNNTVKDNVASKEGGGIWCSGNPTKLLNSLIISNTSDIGGGLFCDQRCKITNSTICNNSAKIKGGGVYYRTESNTSSIDNTIMWNNASPYGPNLYIDFSIFTPVIVNISYSDIKDGAQSTYVGNGSQINWGNGVINQNPLFVNDYYLSQPPCQSIKSPCVDSGLGSAQSNGMDTYWTRTDEVPDSGTVDMGYHYTIETIKEAKWVILVYFCADNDLSIYADAVKQTLEKTGSTDDVKILALIDKNGNNDTHLYEIQSGTSQTISLSLINPSWTNELDMSEKETLEEVFCFLIDNYAAENYSIILKSHGNGWETTLEDKSGRLRINELGDALKNIKTHLKADIHLIGFDVCSMGMVEVAYEIRESANVMVGSEMEIYWSEWPYEKSFTQLISNPNMDAVAFSELIVDEYQTILNEPMSAINLKKVDSLAVSVNSLASAIISSDNLDDVELVRSKIPEYYAGAGPHIDLYYFSAELADQIIDPNHIIYKKANQVMDEFEKNNVVIKTNQTGIYDNGIAIYFPKERENHMNSYHGNKISFTIDYDWDDFLDYYYLINKGGLGYTGDATPGGSVDIRIAGLPLTFPVIMWIGSSVLNPPINLPSHGDWYLGFPIILEIQLGLIPQNGVLSCTCKIPSNLPVPLDLPLQAVVGKKLTNLLELKIQ